MTNPTGLDLKVPDAAFFDNYDTGQGYTPPPIPKEDNGKGGLRYKKFTVTLPQSQGVEVGSTRDGFLKAVVKGIKFDNGYEINQTHVSSGLYNKYDKQRNIVGKRNSSPLADMFRAAGVDITTIKPSTQQEYENLLNEIAGRQAQITSDWSAYDSETTTEVAKKYEDFPLLTVQAANGRKYISVEDAVSQGEVAETLTVIDNPIERQPFLTINGKNFWARGNVKSWISAI